MSDRRTQPGRAATPARAGTISPDVHRFLNVLARCSFRRQQWQSKRATLAQTANRPKTESAARHANA